MFVKDVHNGSQCINVTSLNISWNNNVIVNLSIKENEYRHRMVTILSLSQGADQL